MGMPRVLALDLGDAGLDVSSPAQAREGALFGEHIGDVSGRESGSSFSSRAEFFLPCHGLSLRMLFMCFFPP